ncbi:MAG: carboxypeptidase regulatory-like domain-containing protein, partial [Archangium sp.]|nr:carboxypeptidase regulatory-like domain-containing protein [Archangium sp.]
PFAQLFNVASSRTTDLGTLEPLWLGESAADSFITGRVLGAGPAVDGGQPLDAGEPTGVSDVQGARVSFKLTGAGAQPIAVAVVDAFGAFGARVPPGEYTLTATHPYFLEVTRTVSVDSGQQLDLSSRPLLLPLNPATVEGTVLREVDGQPAVAAEGALVVSDTGRTAVVEPDGTFTLTDLAAGTRTLRITLGMHHDPSGPITVQLQAGATSTLAPVTLHLDRGSLTGEVELIDGAPATQVVIDIPNTSYTTVAVPPAPGASRARFVLTGVPTRSLIVRASKSDYISQSSSPMTPVRDGVVDVGLLRLARLGGAFTIDDGDPFNQPGFTRTTGVTLRLANTANAAEYRVLEGTPSALLALPWASLGGTSLPFTLSTGDGLKTVLLQLRTATGDEGAILESSVMLDGSAPDVSMSSVTLESPTLNAFTNTELVLARLSLGMGAETATSVKVATAASATTCVANDFALALSMPVVSAYPVTLGAGDGPKRVCVQVFDAAGNPSSTIFATITLDKTPPATPVVLTADDQFLPLANNGTFVVTTAGPVVETNFSAYQQLGGDLTAWTSSALAQATTSFTFRVVNTGAEDGTRNLLRLRAVDLAGNFSGEAVLFVTADTNAPDAIPPIREEYIDHGNGIGTVFWLPSPSGAAGYRFYYGPTDTDLTGTWAPQGPSPIDVGDRRSLTLTNLVNDTTTFVRIAPYDRAGNEGPRVGGPSVSARLFPGVVSPNLVATLPLTLSADGGTSLASAMSIGGQYAYVLGHNGGRHFLGTIELSALQSPIQGGAIDLDAGQISQVSVIDIGPGTSLPSGPRALLADGPLLYVAAGRFLRIFGLENPRSPTLKVELDFGALNPGYTLREVQGVYGHKVMVTGNPSPATQQLDAVVDVSLLHDDDASTRPTLSDVQLSLRAYLPPTSFPVGTLLIGNRIVTANGWWADDQLGDALDSDTGTIWGPEDYRVVATPTLGQPVDTHRGSGQLVVSTGSSGVTVTDLSDGGATQVGRLVAGTIGTPALVGAELVTWKSSGLGDFTVVDLSQASTPTQTGHLLATGPGGLLGATWGGYAFVLFGGNVLAFELSTPRALTSRASAVGSTGSGLQLEPGFAFTSSGRAWDLYGGLVPPAIEADGPCQTRAAWWPGIEIGANGNQLLVTDIDAITDRNPLSVTTRTPIPLGTFGRRVSGVAAWGDYLVAAEVRTDAGVNGDGLWLEVFDVSKATDRTATSTLSMADRKTEFKIAPLPFITGVIDPLPVRTQLDVTMNAGRAVISTEVLNYSGGIPQQVQFYDLRALFDDDATTPFSPDAGYQGGLSIPAGVSTTVTQGGFAWSIGGAGLFISDVSAAFDDDPATLVSGTPQVSFGATRGGTGLSVKGSRLFTAGGVVTAYDVKRPLTPVVTSTGAFASTSLTCRPNAETFDRPIRGSIEPAGSVLLQSAGGAFNVIDPE